MTAAWAADAVTLALERIDRLAESIDRLADALEAITEHTIDLDQEH
jgi:hypothetical protein